LRPKAAQRFCHLGFERSVCFVFRASDFEFLTEKTECSVKR